MLTFAPLADLVAKDELDYSQALLVEKIANCESGEKSDATNSNSTAYGYCQFLDGTWTYVQKKWGITLDRNNLDDQLYACYRLLNEEGTIHWKASENCWSK